MSALQTVVVDALLVLASLVALVSGFGVLAMGDPFQRMHYLAPAATFGSFLVVVALVVDGESASGCLEAILVGFVLTLQNAVVTHASARAFFVRRFGCWPPPRDLEIPTDLRDEDLGDDEEDR